MNKGTLRHLWLFLLILHSLPFSALWLFHTNLTVCLFPWDSRHDKIKQKIYKTEYIEGEEKTVSSGSSENSVPCTLKFSPCFKQWLSTLNIEEGSLHLLKPKLNQLLLPSTKPVRPHRERRDNHALTNMQLPLVLSWSSPFINPSSPSLACSPRWNSGPWCFMMMMTSSASISAFNHHFATLATPCGGWAESKTSHASRISLVGRDLLLPFWAWKAQDNLTKFDHIW